MREHNSLKDPQEKLQSQNGPVSYITLNYQVFLLITRLFYLFFMFLRQLTVKVNFIISSHATFTKVKIKFYFTIEIMFLKTFIFQPTTYITCLISI